jgi:hypothetical protein
MTPGQWYVGFHANGETDLIRVPCVDRHRAQSLKHTIERMCDADAVTHATFTTDTGPTAIRLSTVRNVRVDRYGSEG